MENGNVIDIKPEDEAEIVAFSPALIPITAKTVNAIQEIERSIESFKNIKMLALKMTTEGDWTDQGGKPYLEGWGAKKIAPIFGISYRFVNSEHKVKEVRLDNGHIRFEAEMKFWSDKLGTEIEEIGTRSSDDPFYTKKYDWKDGIRKEKILSPQEIDMGDVKKSAILNAVGRGVSGILGLRNLAWEDLQKGNLNVEKIRSERSVKYDKKEQDGKQQGEKDYPIAKGQKEEITKLLSSIPDDFVRMTKISEILYGKDVNKIIENLDKVTWKEAKKVIEALNKEKK